MGIHIQGQETFGQDLIAAYLDVQEAARGNIRWLEEVTRERLASFGVTADTSSPLPPEQREMLGTAIYTEYASGVELSKRRVAARERVERLVYRFAGSIIEATYVDAGDGLESPITKEVMSMSTFDYVVIERPYTARGKLTAYSANDARNGILHLDARGLVRSSKRFALAMTDPDRPLNLRVVSSPRK